jgi:hypothetical protein
MFESLSDMLIKVTGAVYNIRARQNSTEGKAEPKSNGTD